MVRLKQARIVHTLETINDRPAHKCYTAGIFPYFKVCINLADLHRKNKFYFIIFPHSLKDQISFFHICCDILHFSIYTYLNRTRAYPGWDMDSQDSLFLCFSGYMIGHSAIPRIVAFYGYIHLIKVCFCACRDMRINSLFSLTPQIFAKRHQQTHYIGRTTCTCIPARTLRQNMLISI